MTQSVVIGLLCSDWSDGPTCCDWSDDPVCCDWTTALIGQIIQSVVIGLLCSDWSDGSVCCDWSTLLWLVRWFSLKLLHSQTAILHTAWMEISKTV